MNTDLIRSLLPGSEAGLSSELGLAPDAPGDQLYRCFIGLLAGRSARRASLAELNEAAASGWAGLPTSLPATN